MEQNERPVKKFLIIILSILLTSPAHSITYTQADSILVVKMLQKGVAQPKGCNMVLYYANQLKGTPYVAATLEVNKQEDLVVNFRQLDCTTLVETVTALTLTTREGSTDWHRFCHWLQKIRYHHGNMKGYASRNHYFSQWIDSNTDMGIVDEIIPADGTEQILDLHYMSQHPQQYPMLKDNLSSQKEIRKLEKISSGKKILYIPKSRVGQSRKNLAQINDGDILAIVTSKDGLDTSHLGFAVWGTDNKLHLLNASQIHKKVVLEPMTLYQYMQKHPSQIGIRVIRITE